MLNNWIDIRFKYYIKRKEQWLITLNLQMNKLINLYDFIKAVVDGDLVINNRKKLDIIEDLIEMEFDMINDSYDYLLTIPMYYTSKEKYDEYKSLAKMKKIEIKTYSELEPEDIWIKDLEDLSQQLIKSGY
jgi:DNA topoisomerase-2